MSDQVKDVCLQELERINKEIETVRHQVEQEQRQLSNYQTVQADKGDLASISHLSRSKTFKSIDTRAYDSLPYSYLEDRKYVVDDSKPRTDLEYDPLSNFSSDLSSYSSSRREQKLKNVQSLKKARMFRPCDQNSSTQTQLSRLPSPESVDEWMEDDILIIDVPPSPQKKGGQRQKRSHSVTEKSQGHEIKEAEVPSILLDFPLQHSKPEIKTIGDNKHAETKNLANLYEGRACDNVSDGVSGADFKKSLETPHSLTNLQVEKERKTLRPNLSHFEPPHGAGKMNTVQQNCPSNTSFLSKTTAATLDLQCRARTEQAQDMTHAQSRVSNRISSVNAQSVLPLCQKSLTKIPGAIQGKPENPGEVEENLSSQTPQNRPVKTAESSASSQLLEKDHERVIVIDSSSDETNYLEMEVSDSDPMEECYRIFMEENEHKTEILPDAPVSWLLMSMV